MENSEESPVTINEICPSISCNTSSINTECSPMDTNMTDNAVTNDVIKSENAPQAIDNSVESSPNSSRITENNDCLSNNMLDQSQSEDKELVIDTHNEVIQNKKGKLLVSSEGVMENVDEGMDTEGTLSDQRDIASSTCAIPIDGANCLPSTSTKEDLGKKSNGTNKIMPEDQDDKQRGERNSVPENFSGDLDECSSEEELSESMTSGPTPGGFFGIELDSAAELLKENTCKNLSKEMDVSHDISIASLSDDEPVIIDSKLSEGDSLSLHRGAVVPYSDTEDSDSSSDSSTYESSSDESSDDSSSLSETENKAEKVKKSATTKSTKLPGELDLDDLPPIQDLHISVRNDQVVEIGKILHAVDTLVVVEGYKDQPPLDIESVLFLDRGTRPLGRIFDVMGPVKEPLYCVRFNSKQHIEEQNIKPDMLVYCAPQTEHSNFVFLQHLLMMKGSDASWKKDREIPVSCLDFSDDEEEARIKKADNRKKVVNSTSAGEPSPKAARTNNQQSSGARGPGFCENQGRVFRPRNPWGWPGTQNNDRWNQQHLPQPHPPPPPPRLANSYRVRGHVQPPSFHVESQFHSQSTYRNFESGVNRYPSHPQFGMEPDSRMLSQPPTSGFNAPWPSPEISHPPPYHTAPTGYCQRPSMNPWQSPSRYPQNSPHDQRYQAFQTEIARLVDAYNRGADSPMAVPPPPPVRPPGPSSDWNSSMSNQNYYSG